MRDGPAAPETTKSTAGVAERGGQLTARLRRRLRAAIARPSSVKLAGRAIYGVLNAVRRSQTVADGSSDHRAILTEHHPAIVGLWHGQHLLAPFFRPAELPYVALLSRNADAAINAAVVEHFGIGTIRGSGGRVRRMTSKKGGAQALLQLVRTLRGGTGVCMIADVVKGVPREAGLGIVTLARLSGRPIVPAAAVTSRRFVLRNTWDRTTLPLPFGRMAVVLGAPIFVPADADDATMDAKRREVTVAIEAANREALALADRTSAP